MKQTLIVIGSVAIGIAIGSMAVYLFRIPTAEETVKTFFKAEIQTELKKLSSEELYNSCVTLSEQIKNSQEQLTQ